MRGGTMSERKQPMRSSVQGFQESYEFQCEYLGLWILQFLKSVFHKTLYLGWRLEKRKARLSDDQLDLACLGDSSGNISCTSRWAMGNGLTVVLKSFRTILLEVPISLKFLPHCAYCLRLRILSSISFPHSFSSYPNVMVLCCSWRKSNEYLSIGDE